VSEAGRSSRTLIVAVKKCPTAAAGRGGGSHYTSSSSLKATSAFPDKASKVLHQYEQ
jgi:hypothetical protein